MRPAALTPTMKMSHYESDPRRDASPSLGSIGVLFSGEFMFNVLRPS
jgi:hypothetical protein